MSKRYKPTITVAMLERELAEIDRRLEALKDDLLAYTRGQKARANTPLDYAKELTAKRRTLAKKIASERAWEGRK